MIVGKIFSRNIFYFNRNDKAIVLVYALRACRKIKAETRAEGGGGKAQLHSL